MSKLDKMLVEIVFFPVHTLLYMHAVQHSSSHVTPTALVKAERSGRSDPGWLVPQHQMGQFGCSPVIP